MYFSTCRILVTLTAECTNKLSERGNNTFHFCLLVWSIVVKNSVKRVTRRKGLFGANYLLTMKNVFEIGYSFCNLVIYWLSPLL